jgi:hypothetical protein
MMSSRGGEAREEWEAIDPRADDLPVDSRLWSALLTRAYYLDRGEPNGLYGALRGMRCLGARLEETPSGVKLRPGAMSRTEYADLRDQYLMPHAFLVERLPAELGANYSARQDRQHDHRTRRKRQLALPSKGRTA